jgi:diamine N-acetyltransferase
VSIVSLRPIDKTNEDVCAALRVTEDQTGLIAPNTKSLEWAKDNPNCVPLAVYADDVMIGFVMYEPRGNGVFSIHRCMIDAKYQRQGFGRRAMELTIEQIRELGGITIYLSFRPENNAARSLYEGLGFVQHAIEPDGETVYRLGPAREVTS